MIWNLLKIKAIAEENDPLHRKIGSALWKERYNLKALNDIKLMLGGKIFSAMYQQDPSSFDNSRFNLENIKYFNNESDEVINDCKISDNFIFLSVDPAFTNNRHSDYSVIAACGLNAKNDLFVYEVIRKRILAGEHEKEIINIAKKYNTMFVGIEINGGQDYISNFLEANFYKIEKFKANENKENRAQKLGGLFSAGKLYLKSNSYWLDDLLIELEDFPRGRYDDQVDALSYAAMFEYNFISNSFCGISFKKGIAIKGRYNSY